MKQLALAAVVLAALTLELTANEVAEKLFAMSEQARNEELTSRIGATGNRCDTVTRSMHMNNNSNGTSSWSIECRDKNSYVMVLGPANQQYAIAWKCTDLKTVFPGTGLECFKK